MPPSSFFFFLPVSQTQWHGTDFSGRKSSDEALHLAPDASHQFSHCRAVNTAHVKLFLGTKAHLRLDSAITSYKSNSAFICPNTFDVCLLTLMTPPSFASLIASCSWASLATTFLRTFFKVFPIFPSTIAVAAEQEKKDIIVFKTLMIAVHSLNRNHLTHSQWIIHNPMDMNCCGLSGSDKIMWNSSL